MLHYSLPAAERSVAERVLTVIYVRVTSTVYSRLLDASSCLIKLLSVNVGFVFGKVTLDNDTIFALGI
jgi:hypothetical protein